MKEGGKEGEKEGRKEGRTVIAGAVFVQGFADA